MMDEDEFAAVYAATYKPLLGYALRRCDTPEDAADVVAETFATAWRRAADMPAGDEARLWLYGVARRVLANHRRGVLRHSLKTAALRAELASITPARDETPVADVFRALPGRDRELLALVAWEGLSVAEIATVLGCSRNAVSIRLHRARRRFARALRAAGIDRPGQVTPALQRSAT
ncbi:RNA polymerase sigma factor [Actinomadura formosensis]|uniref:RNA polymerase sigma factor n=1 Tax=Actinomadura formosensis TaxID=60706 RepID=UPI000A8BD58F|nr:RNA polymerase sigma factor [Actinomadura formosensis]